MTKQQKKYRELQRFLRDLYNGFAVSAGTIDDDIKAIPDVLGMKTDAFGCIPANAKFPDLEAA
jgi:hypothetical protein